jgi:hypothetical protein
MRSRLAAPAVVGSWVLVSSLLASFLAPATARACGTSGPDGVSACSLAEHAEEERPRWRAGVSYLYTSTALDFSGSLRTPETRNSALAQLAYAPTARLTVSAGLGVAFGGKLEAPDGSHPFTPGIGAGLGISYRILEGATPLGRAFLLVGGDASFTGASTQHDGTGPKTAYDALDLRASVTGGLTWWQVLSGYLVVRGFGGPVYWTYQGSSVLGTDTHHYQVGGGLALLVAGRVDLFVEGVPLGEQAVAGGVSIAF